MKLADTAAFVICVKNCLKKKSLKKKKKRILVTTRRKSQGIMGTTLVLRIDVNQD